MTHTTVSAYAAPAAKAPLERTTIPRRARGRARRPDRHQVRRHLPLRHPPGPRGLGRGAIFPMVPGHEIAGVVTEVGAERHQVTRSATGSGVGCFVDSCRECENCQAGLEQYCTGERQRRHVQRHRQGRRAHLRRLLHAHRRRRELRRAHPRGHRRWTSPPRCCAPASPSTRRSSTGRPAPARRSPSSAWAASATWASRSRTRWAPRSPCCSQSLRKKDDGLQLGADHYYATSDPATFEELAGTFDLIVSTVSAPLDLDAYLCLLRTDGALVNVGAPEEPVCRSNLFSLIARPQDRSPAR